MTVWLGQCQCPQRHAILAWVGEASGGASAERLTDELRDIITLMQKEQLLNPWCGLCGAASASWSYDIAATRFATQEEAWRALQEERPAVDALFADIHRTERPH